MSFPFYCQVSPICAIHTLRSAGPDLVNLSSQLLKKTESPSPRSDQLSITLQLEVEAPEPYSAYTLEC